MTMWNWDEIKTADNLARIGTLSAAAKKLGGLVEVTPPLAEWETQLAFFEEQTKTWAFT